MRNRSTLPLPTVQVIQPPDALTFPPQNRKYIKRQPSESFISCSSDSSFDSLPESDVQKIQTITKVLDSEIRSKLHRYKKSSFDYNQKFFFLKENLKIYSNEFKEVESSYSNLLITTQKTQDLVNEIKKCPEKSSKTTTEENFTCQSMGEASALDMIKKLKDDVIKIREKIDRNDAEKLGVGESTCEFLQKRKLILGKQNNAFCSCQVI